MNRVVMMVGLFAVLAVTAGCWNDKPSQTPEECKLTTDPEACRKAYQRR